MQAGSSAAGSAWARLPPTVPRARVCRWPMTGAASARSGAAAAMRASRSSACWRTSAPRRRADPSRCTAASPETRFRSTTTAGRTRRMFIIGTRLCPPARSLASPPWRARRSSASSSRRGARYSKGAGRTYTRPSLGWSKSGRFTPHGAMRARIFARNSGKTRISSSGVLPPRPGLARDAVGVDLGRRGVAALDGEPEVPVAAELDVLDHRAHRALDAPDRLGGERRRPRVQALPAEGDVPHLVAQDQLHEPAHRGVGGLVHGGLEDVDQDLLGRAHEAREDALERGVRVEGHPAHAVGAHRAQPWADSAAAGSSRRGARPSATRPRRGGLPPGCAW